MHKESKNMAGAGGMSEALYDGQLVALAEPPSQDGSRSGHGQFAEDPDQGGAADDQRTAGPGKPRLPGRRVLRSATLTALVRRHWIFSLAIAEAVIIRVIAMLGFQPAVLFRLDSYDYLWGAAHLSPNVVNTSGYSVFLWLLRPMHSLVLVVALQHVMGLGVATLVYVLLRRYGLPAWGAALAAAPVLFDPAQLLAEQLVTADLLAMTLMMAGLTVLLIRRSPTLPASAIAGLLIGASVIVRPTTLPLVVLVPVYLLIPRGRMAAGSRLAAQRRGPGCRARSCPGVHGLVRGRGRFVQPDEQQRALPVVTDHVVRELRRHQAAGESARAVP
jgi:hypothetical protein